MPRPFNPNSYHGWRKLVLKRDEYKCVACGAKDNLQCDHIKPVKTNPELIYDLDNGRVLCFSCHKKTDTYGGKMLKGRIVERNPYGPF